MKHSIFFVFYISCISLSAQNVGVNLTIPEYTLDVRSTSIGDASQINISNPDKSRYLRLFSGSNTFPDPSMTWSPGHNFLFATFDDVTLNFTEYMRIDSDGIITAPGLDIPEITDAKSLVTKEYVDSNAPTGLEALNEGNGIGFRIKGRNPDNYGNIGLNAVDLSYSSSSSTTNGATGNYSTAIGYNAEASGSSSIALGVSSEASGTRSVAIGAFTEASGERSTALGSLTKASGSKATAMGFSSEATGEFSTSIGRSTKAFGDYSTTMGFGTRAYGTYSTAMGRSTYAPSYGEVAMGFYNTNYIPVDTNSFHPNDRLFVIGNGDSDIVRSNALSILKNGTITAPSLDISEITDHKSLVTKEYVDINGSSGLEMIDEGNGDGWRLKGRNYSDYGVIGSNAVDLSYSSTNSSVNGATGAFSIAAGFNSIASGNHSKSIGFDTDAPSVTETVIGSCNTLYIPFGSISGWNENDRLFVIGNGDPNGARSNALTILKSADIGVVTDTPQAKLHISEGNDTGLGANNGFLLLGETSGANISMDNNEIMAKNNGNAADLNLQIEGGNLKIGGPVFIGDETIEDAGNNALRFNAALLPDVDNVNVLGNPTQRWTTVYATNGTINTSDRREKKNIKDLTYGLSEVLEMQPVSFNWKDKNSPDLKLGLIAQDLQELIPEVVKSHTIVADETSGQVSKREVDRLGVYYSDLVPVLIKAIQEQNEVVIALKQELKNTDEKYKELLLRIEALEGEKSN